MVLPVVIREFLWERELNHIAFPGLSGRCPVFRYNSGGLRLSVIKRISWRARVWRYPQAVFCTQVGFPIGPRGGTSIKIRIGLAAAGFFALREDRLQQRLLRPLDDQFLRIAGVVVPVRACV